MGKSIFYLRLKELSERQGKSFNQIERELNYSRNALSNYKGVASPSAIRLVELSRYFKVRPEYLIGEDSIEENTVEEGITINKIFETFSPIEKYEMYKICDKWVRKYK